MCSRSCSRVFLDTRRATGEPASSTFSIACLSLVWSIILDSPFSTLSTLLNCGWDMLRLDPSIGPYFLTDARNMDARNSRSSAPQSCTQL